MSRRLRTFGGPLLLTATILMTPQVDAESARTDTVVSTPATSPQVFTLLDYFETGRRAVDRFVADSARTNRNRPRLDAIIRRSGQACVRVEIRFGREESGYRSVVGSGVLLDGGRRVLTAGHTMAGVTNYEAIVTRTTGESRWARVIDQEYELYGGATRDWALLEILGPDFDSVPLVELGEIRDGGLAIILGYPDEIGINVEGRVAFGQGSEGERLQPLVTLGTVQRGDRLTLLPRAGFVPTPGMSGAPVFDAEGRLLGVFTSIVRAGTESEVRYIYKAAPVTALGKQLFGAPTRPALSEATRNSY